MQNHTHRLTHVCHSATNGHFNTFLWVRLIYQSFMMHKTICPILFMYPYSPKSGIHFTKSSADPIFFSSSGTIKRVEYCIYMRTKTNTHLSQHAIQTRLSKQVKHQFNLIDPTLVEVCPVGMKDKCIENRFDSILLKYAICHTCTLLCPIRFSFHIGYGLVTIVLLGR